jgi:hypothetical protein
MGSGDTLEKEVQSHDCLFEPNSDGYVSAPIDCKTPSISN